MQKSRTSSKRCAGEMPAWRWETKRQEKSSVWKNLLLLWFILQPWQTTFSFRSFFITSKTHFMFSKFTSIIDFLIYQFSFIFVISYELQLWLKQLLRNLWRAGSLPSVNFLRRAESSRPVNPLHQADSPRPDDSLRSWSWLRSPEANTSWGRR